MSITIIFVPPNDYNLAEFAPAKKYPVIILKNVIQKQKII